MTLLEQPAAANATWHRFKPVVEIKGKKRVTKGWSCSACGEEIEGADLPAIGERLGCTG